MNSSATSSNTFVHEEDSVVVDDALVFVSHAVDVAASAFIFARFDSTVLDLLNSDATVGT